MLVGGQVLWGTPCGNATARPKPLSKTGKRDEEPTKGQAAQRTKVLPSCVKQKRFLQKMTNDARISMKTKGHYGKPPTKAGMSMKTQVISRLMRECYVRPNGADRQWVEVPPR